MNNFFKLSSSNSCLSVLPYSVYFVYTCVMIMVTWYTLAVSPYNACAEIIGGNLCIVNGEALVCFFTECSPSSRKERSLSSNATCYIARFHRQNLTVAIVCVIYLHVSAFKKGARGHKNWCFFISCSIHVDH